jgi:HSP20 family protein
MAIVRYDPFRSIFGLPKWVDDIDGDFPAISSQKGLRIHETDKNLILEAVVAGIPADDVEVNIEDGVITIKAETKREEKGNDEYKSSYYQYYYSTALSGGDWHKAEAEIKNGVVTVTIPKAEAAKPRKITVRSSEK